MMHPELDRTRLNMGSITRRANLLRIGDIAADPSAPPAATGPVAEQIGRVAERLVRARRAERPVVMAYGAHAIKNGLGPVMVQLAESGWITHFATNGAGAIHDWEFAFCGETAEDVRANVATGTFGIWEETGKWTSLAVLVGACQGLGYGQAVGAMIEQEALCVPEPEALRAKVLQAANADAPTDAAAAAADLWDVITRFGLRPGRQQIAHPWKRYSVCAAAYRLGIPLTVHPGIGYDIIYTHPLSHGGAIGRAALRDFLIYADAVRRLTAGVYLSVGSAIMSPMVFEKSMSMAQNLAIQEGTSIHDHFIAVNDIQEGQWDWSEGEPPKEHPAYYLRYCKSFSRMGGELEYVCADNRVFLGQLLATLS